MFNIKYFNMTTVTREGKITESNSKDGKFTAEQKKNLKSLKGGDKIYFDNVLVSGFDSITRNIGEKMYIVE